MPWFSRKKKRKQKNVVVNNTAKDDTVVATTSKPAFSVVVQDFLSGASDQISVERGQVIEVLFTVEDWVYVKNVNGHCGYIPGEFCFPLDRLRMGDGGQDEERRGDKVRQMRAHPRPTTIHVDTFDEPAVEGGGRGTEIVEEEEEDEEVNSPDSGISCSHQASSTNMESVASLHNTRERLTIGNSSRAMGAGSGTSHTHHQTRHLDRHKQFLMPNSSIPLLETVSLAASSRGHPDHPLPHSPSPPPLPPITDTPGHVATPTANTADSSNREDPPSRSSDGDDVFLPEANKPLGIYQCSETYQPQFEGEIPLQRDEVVVVLEAGASEWVWAMGSEGKEGLVLKSLLHKYRPDVPEDDEEDEIDIGEEEHGTETESDGSQPREVESSTAAGTVSATPADSEILTSSSGTQTELVIDGVVRELTGCVPHPPSSSSAAPSSSSSSSSSTGATHGTTASVSIQTEFTLPNWFKNNTPVATPCHTMTRTSQTDENEAQAVTNTSRATSHTPSSLPLQPHQNHQNHTSHSSHTTTSPTGNHRTSPPNPSSSSSSSTTARILCTPRSSTTASTATATSPPPRETYPRLSNTPSSGVRSPPNGQRAGQHTPGSTPPRPTVTVQTAESSQAVTSGPVNNTGEQQQQQQQQQGLSTRRTTTTTTRPTTTRPGTAAPNNGTGTIQRHRQALLQHSRIINSIPFEPDNEATAATPTSRSTRRRMQPTPIVTATRDYSPPQRARNALTLRRGEIMYAQPHVPFPHGWVWVYHTLHKRYGYVPKDHIAYMYLVQKDHGSVLEDVV